MNGRNHALVGFSAGLAYGASVGHPVWVWPLCGVVACAASSGHTSPDMDQAAWWRLLDRWVPDEWLGEGGPMQHRGITHWWGLPAIVAAVMLAVDVTLTVGGTVLPVEAVLWPALVGWVSHILADAVAGAKGYGRAAGVPVWPWWGHRGLGYKSDGWVASCVAWSAIPLTIAVLWVA